jgi:hypothetical protein
VNGRVFYHGKIGKVCEKCVKFGVALKRRVASARLRAMKGDTGKTDSAPAFVLCPPGCADAVRRALPPGCDVVVAGSPEEARTAFAERTGAPSEPGAGEVAVDGRTIDLTTLERAVFEVLSRAPGRTVSRAALLREIHGDAAGSVLPRVVDSTVSRLRRKLGPSGWRVETVWGRGYRWNAGDRPAVRPFLQALRWSAGTLGVILVATLLVPRPRPEEPSPPVAEPAPVIETPVAVEPSAGEVGDCGDIGDIGDASPDSLTELSVAEPAPKPEPAPAPARSAKRAASAPAASRAAAACAPAPIPAVVLPPDGTLAPKDGFEIHVMTAEDKTLSNLARSRGITLAELLAANPQIADPDLVRAGQPVYLPIPSARPEPAP